MKDYILKFICALLISTLTLLLSACNVSETYKPTSDTTWGDLCRQFELMWYNSLSDEFTSQLDNLLLSENYSSKNNDQSISVSTPVYKEVENSSDAGYTIYDRDAEIFISKKNTEDVISIAQMINEQDRAIDYMISANTSINEYPTNIIIVIAISDTESGEYLAINTGVVAITNNIDGIVDSFTNLEHNHRYTVQTIAVVEPPEGYTSGGPLYIEKEVTTIEPTSITK